MTSPIEVLNKTHQKKDFNCGKELLDNYLHYQAGQDLKRKLSVCFVLINPENNIIKGYYTLSNSSVPLHWLKEDIRKKLPPSYKRIPVTLLGRLAVDVKYRGEGLGRILLVDALKRSLEASEKIGSFAIVVDPIDKDAEGFYEKYSFIKIPDTGKMFLPMKTIKNLFED